MDLKPSGPEALLQTASQATAQLGRPRRFHGSELPNQYPSYMGNVRRY